MTWQLQDAKNKLSEVVETTLAQGPQIISRRGKNTVVLITYEDYIKQAKPQPDLQAVFKHYKGLDFPEISRERDTVGRASPHVFGKDAA